MAYILLYIKIRNYATPIKEMYVTGIDKYRFAYNLIL